VAFLFSTPSKKPKKPKRHKPRVDRQTAGFLDFENKWKRKEKRCIAR
jgi:hypothetical protein